MPLKRKVKEFLYFIKKFPKIIFPPKVEKTVVVLGMGRSGTSVVANILKELGVDMGERLLGKTYYNKKGHFENNVIKSLNKDILNHHKADWSHPPSVEEVKGSIPLFVSKVRRTIAIEQSKVWGWKDPRTVITLEHFLPHLKCPYFVVCRRKHEDVARSLEVRYGTPFKEGVALSELYNGLVDNFIRETNYKVFEINYETLLSKPDIVIKKLVDFLDIPVTQTQSEELAKIVDPTISTTNF